MQLSQTRDHVVLLHGKYAERATCRRERRGCGEEVRVSGLSMLRLEQLQVGGLRHGLIEIDCEIRVCRYRDVHRVADHDRAGRDRRRALAAEEERPPGPWRDPGVLPAQGEVSAADYERRRAERITEHHPRAIAANAGMDNLPQRLIVEIDCDDRGGDR